MNIDQQVLQILQDKGVNSIRFTREDIGTEYLLDSTAEVLDLFNQLDVKGKDIVFAPTNTIHHIGTLAEAVYVYGLPSGTALITKFKFD